MLSMNHKSATTAYCGSSAGQQLGSWDHIVAHCDSIAEAVLTMAEILVPLAAVVVAGRPVHAGSVAFLVGDPIQVMRIRLWNVILIVMAIVPSRFDDCAQLRTRLHVPNSPRRHHHTSREIFFCRRRRKGWPSQCECCEVQCLQCRISVKEPLVEVEVDRCGEERSMVAVQRQEPRSFFGENFVAGV